MPSEKQLLADQILGYELASVISEDQANYVRHTPFKYRRIALDKMLHERDEPASTI